MINIIQDPSPNFNDRAAGKKIKYIILHYTGTKTFENAMFLLKGGNPDHKVSAHYAIDLDGAIYQLVDEKHRAWHAGKSCWDGEDDINSTSIGVELQNKGHEHGYHSFPDAQIAALILLLKDVMPRHGISPQNVLGHEDIAPGRKQDPGELFPWERLSEEALAVSKNNR